MAERWRSVRSPMLLVSVLLLAQITVFYGMSTREYVPSPPPLKTFPATVDSWTMISQSDPESDITDLLRADDWLNRDYAGPEGGVNLWVAFYKTQRQGVSPHSPKVCLPGNGWEEDSNGTVSVSVPGEAAPIRINRYSVHSGQNRMLAFYWYQTPHRVVANEYVARVYLILDGLRYRRSDTAMIRVLSRIVSDDEDASQRRAVGFIQKIYAPLKQQMWQN